MRRGGVRMAFTHLQVRSAYSLLNSSITIRDYVALAKERQMKALALVEDGTMHSAIKFYQACKVCEIKPLIGLTLKVKLAGGYEEWTLMAKNSLGYESLLALASLSALHGDGVEFEEIRTRSSHLIVITNGESGMLASMVMGDNEEDLNRYYHQYLEPLAHLYIGLLRVNQQTYEVSGRLISFSRRMNLKTVALNDVRYLNQEDAKTLTLLRAIKANQSVEQIQINDVERYFKTEEQMRQLFADHLEAIDQTTEIVNSCEIEILLHQSLLPKFKTPEGTTSSTYLEALCYKGLLKRYGNDVSDVHKRRLSHELSVIRKMGFCDYF